MSITLGLVRPKTQTTNAQSTTLSVGSSTDTSTSTEESFFIPVQLSAVTPPTFTIPACTTTSSSETVTTSTANGFAEVYPGDGISGTGIPSGTTVASKTNSTTIVLSQAATASGTATLTDTPPSITPTVYAIRVRHTAAGSVFGLLFDLFVYDGTLEGVAGSATNYARTVSLVPVDGKQYQINIDSFLSNLRVPQSS